MRWLGLVAVMVVLVSCGGARSTAPSTVRPAPDLHSTVTISATQQQQSRSSLMPVEGIEFSTTSVGYGLGNSSSLPYPLLRTDDGGRNWTAAGPLPQIACQSENDPILEELRPFGFDEVWLLLRCDNQHLWNLYQSLDAARHWLRVATGTSRADVLAGSPLAPAMTTWSLERDVEPYRLLKVTTGSTTEESLLDTSIYRVLDFSRLANGHGWVLAALHNSTTGCTLLKTSDDGRTWSRSDLPCIGSHIRFVDDRHGWILGDNQLFATDDGGQTWREIR